jgi:ribosomal protein L11 methyltransferase
MREIVLTVPAVAVEDVLDRLLPSVPAGVREEPAGDSVRLRMRGQRLPSRAMVALAAAAWPHEIDEAEVPDDWRERRLLDYREEVVGGRLVVRPEWAPPAAAGELEIALNDDLAFGSGSHPTTRAVLELVLQRPVLGAFGDLGCGSGVAAILAAKLGWAPVIGCEIVPASVASARRNAERNDVQVEFRACDLLVEAPPAVDAFVANIAAPVHPAVAASAELRRARWGVLSGFGPIHEPDLIPAYEAVGLGVCERREIEGWSVIVVERHG